LTIVPLFWDWPALYGWLAAGLVFLYTLWDAVIVPRIKLRFWRYEIRDDEIDIRHGVFIIRRTLIPMIRVQHVDTEHGPIMRLFGLATLKDFHCRFRAPHTGPFQGKGG